MLWFDGRRLFELDESLSLESEEELSEDDDDELLELLLELLLLLLLELELELELLDEDSAEVWPFHTRSTRFGCLSVRARVA